MDCHLFIDEVGNSDLDHPDERYLSLTGIITKVDGHGKWITNEIEKLKSDLFGHNPPSRTIILHRKDILNRRGPFAVLKDTAKNIIWEERILDLIGRLPYIAITVVIDKHAHNEKYGVWKYDPYHYCMHNLMERYALWLNRHDLIGNVVIEPRYKKADKALKKSFAYVYANGTENIPASLFQKRLTSKELRFEQKQANVCGLQLVDLLAYPSQLIMRKKHEGQPISPTAFGTKIYDVLERKKFARHPTKLHIDGWGRKWLP